MTNLVAQYKQEIASLRGMIAAMTANAKLGAAVQRAAAELPEGYELGIEIEKDAGTVRLYLPDTDATIDNFDGDSFTDYINAAIEEAKRQASQ